MKSVRYVFTGVLVFVTVCVIFLDSWLLGIECTDVLSRSYNIDGNSVTLEEHLLNHSNVNHQSFGKIFTRDVVGHVYAQVLYAKDVNAGGRKRNVIYVATMSNFVYAFDADRPEQKRPIWVRQLGPSAPVSDNTFGQRCVEVYHQPRYQDIAIDIGIVGTPVIHKSTNRMYVVALNKISDSPFQYEHKLHVLDIRTGRTILNPVTIDPTYEGNGDQSIGQTGTIKFQSQYQMNRGSLTISPDGIVYIAFGSYCDTRPYHGWILGYDKETLQLKRKWVSTPDTFGGSVWNSGQKISFNQSGSLIFVLTANGPYDPSRSSYGSSFVLLKTDDENDGIMKVVRHLHPNDPELGLTSAFRMPDTNYILGSGKNGLLYVLDPTMGRIIQRIRFPSHIHKNPVFWKDSLNNQNVYIWGKDDVLKQFRVNNANGMLELYRSASLVAPFPGGFSSLSSNGDKRDTAILWTSTGYVNANHRVSQGRLIAYDANDVSRILYMSTTNEARDRIGEYAKFNEPTVANGIVYVPTFSDPPSNLCHIHAYGILRGSGNGNEDVDDDGNDDEDDSANTLCDNVDCTVQGENMKCCGDISLNRALCYDPLVNTCSRDRLCPVNTKSCGDACYADPYSCCKSGESFRLCQKVNENSCCTDGTILE